MRANVIIHRPTLTEKEREYRMEQIKQATIKFHSDVMKNEKTRINRSASGDGNREIVV